jgi:hypothetical protein
VCANVALGYNHAAIFEFGGTSEYPRLEVSLGSGLLLPLVVRYENKELSIYGNGVLLATSPVQPGYDIWIPRLLGADGAVVTSGFQGQVAEWLFYNRALGDYERGLVEQYVMTRYQMESSSSSSSEESSSEESSWSSSEESSWSSEESSMESSWESSMESSWESSMESSGETSSGTSGYVPDPVPVTSGLVAWQRSDLHVQKDFNNQVTVWGGADGVLPAALRATFNGPVEQWNVFGNQPALLFTGAEGLRLQAGNLGSNSFTLFVVGCPAGHAWDQGVLLGSDNQTGAVAQISASQAQVQVSEPGGSSGVRLQATTFGCLCPVSLVYQNKQARLYWLGQLMAQSTSTPAYDILIPKLIGGPGAGGFFGSIAEVLMYNRALSDGERQQVEAYLMGRYQCLPSITSSEDSSGEPPSSSSSSDDDSSSSSSSSSSSESESDEGDSSESSSSSDDLQRRIWFETYLAWLKSPYAQQYPPTELIVATNYQNALQLPTVQLSWITIKGLEKISDEDDIKKYKLTIEAAANQQTVSRQGFAAESVGFTFYPEPGTLETITTSIGVEATKPARAEEKSETYNYRESFEAALLSTVKLNIQNLAPGVDPAVLAQVDASLTAYLGSSAIDTEWRLGFQTKASAIPKPQIDSVAFNASVTVAVQNPPQFHVGTFLLSGSVTGTFQPGLHVQPTYEGVLEFRIDPRTGSNLLDFIIKGLRLKINFLGPDGAMRFDIQEQGEIWIQYSTPLP